MSRLRLGIVIGRFQPVHHGHMLDVLTPAYRESDHLLILLGSANRAPSPRNPFDPATRYRLIQEALVDAGYPEAVTSSPSKVQFRELDDFSYSDSLWVAQVQRLVTEYQDALRIAYQRDVDVVIYATDKDSSTYYIRMFPQWGLRLGEPNRVDHYSASVVRNSLFSGTSAWETLVPDRVAAFLREWIESPEGQWNRKEHEFYEKYRQPYDDFRKQVGHGYIANTCDAVVWHKGRILLVKRAFHPGKGLWALPGGYLNENELPLDGAMRECREETRFRLRPSWCFAERVYANPGRSLKGRTITHGFGFRVPDVVDLEEGSAELTAALQAIRGDSDASGAAWVPIHDIVSRPEFRRGMFEDHWDIVNDMLKSL
ncbi:MAG: NUDIX domain-containing protein [Myxococcales bacterium]|nr:NUDIX domain-containing protein [Myxococcales bacterium]